MVDFTKIVGVTGASVSPLQSGESVMPRNGIPQFFHPEIRHLIQVALEEAWQEIKDEQLADAKSVKDSLATTVVALAAIGETNTAKLKNFAVHAARAKYRPQKRLSARRQSELVAAQTF